MENEVKENKTVTDSNNNEKTETNNSVKGLKKDLFKGKNIKIIIVSIVLIIGIIVSSVLLFNKNSTSVSYLRITDDGAVYLAPEYVNIEYYLQEKRFSDTDRDKIVCQSKDAAIYPEEYVFVAMLSHGDYDYLFNDVEELKAAISSLEDKHQTKIRALYDVMKEENPFIDFIIRCKLSNELKLNDVDILEIPNKINGVKVTSVAPYGFYNCANIKEIVLPDSVTSVGKSAFENSAIQNLTFKADKIDIEYSCIRNCTQLERIMCGPEKQDILPTIEVAF